MQIITNSHNGSEDKLPTEFIVKKLVHSIYSTPWGKKSSNRRMTQKLFLLCMQFLPYELDDVRDEKKLAKTLKISPQAISKTKNELEIGFSQLFSVNRLQHIDKEWCAELKAYDEGILQVPDKYKASKGKSSKSQSIPGGI